MIPGKYLVVGMQKVANNQREMLYSLGVMPGHSIQIVSVGCFGGPLVIEVNGLRWALARSLWDGLETVARTSP